MDDFQKGVNWYYSSAENRLKTFRKAKQYLNRIFDVSLTMSDKMELRREVNLMISEACEVADPVQCFEAEHAAVFRFLTINYPSLERELVARAIVSHYPIKRLNAKIRSLREKCEIYHV